jgi:signal transduction histidine kinase
MVKIVVIEDEADIREEVMTWLEVEGYEVIGANNGRQGLELIYREQPDLVLCDINMPEMDGHSVLIELRSGPNYAQLPFIFLTASADRDSMRKGMNLGADDYITKPFTYADVITAVKSRLGKQEQIRSQIDRLSNLIDAEREQRLLKSRLIGMFSHDFRNPLTSILSSSNILQNYSDRLKPERQQRHFQRIDGAVHLLLQMLDEMLMVAEIEHGHLSYNPQPTDLKKLIEKVIEDFQLIDGEKHPIADSINLPDLVTIDPKLAHHILTNLVSNALKYSPDGREIDIQAYIKEKQVVISVQDAGIGIHEDDLAHVFEPFFRADNAHNIKGTGLGLSLVKQIVKVCGGTIQVTSELVAGSCFSVRLPFDN